MWDIKGPQGPFISHMSGVAVAGQA
jgi:hypothetical protein